MAIGRAEQIPAKIPAIAHFTIGLRRIRVKRGGIGVHWQSMFCPECEAEYVEGVHGCPDCRVPLVPELPPPPQLEYVEYVTVLKTGNPIVLAMVKSILTSAEIRHYVKGEVLQELFRVGTAEVQVGRDDEPEARNLLREFKLGTGEIG